MAWDSPLGAVAELVMACADGVDATAETLTISRLVVAMPIELQSRVGRDGTVVEVAPPRQAVATTVMPVLHQIRIGVVADR